MSDMFDVFSDLFRAIMDGGTLLWNFFQSEIPEELYEMGIAEGTTWFVFILSVGIPLVLTYHFVRMFI